MGTKKTNNMKTNNTQSPAIINLVREINRLDTRSAFAFGRGRNHTGAIDGKFADLAALLKVPTSSVEEAYAKLLSVALMPEPQPVRRMARPLPVSPVAPRLTLTGVVPVTVMEWHLGVGEVEIVIGYNVTRTNGRFEWTEFRPKSNISRNGVEVSL